MSQPGSNEALNQRLSNRLERIAPELSYPPLPDLDRRVKQQLETEALHPSAARLRWAWAGLVALLLLGGLIAVQPVRAALLEFLQLGAIRIFLTGSTATPLPATTAPQAAPVTTPRPGSTPLSSVLDLAGETTLAEAQASVGFPIRRPAYPAGLGQPDRVFVQDFGGPVVILVWLAPDRPEAVRLSLHLLGPETFAHKSQPQLVETTSVNGQPALWTRGPYLLQFKTGPDTGRLIEGYTLIWTEGPITYRLETGQSLAVAIRMAESLR